ncbi:MAG: hypothetical protein NTV87_05660, partial [Ignavibacteriae bacterium]|nr:hypothetical protein [Ignavibacteriota bacterium]
LANKICKNNVHYKKKVVKLEELFWGYKWKFIIFKAKITNKKNNNFIICESVATFIIFTLSSY